MAIFSAARLLFFLCNREFLSGETSASVALAFLVGLRFDASTIAIFNAPIWVFWSLPSKLRSWKFFNALAQTWFFAVNFLIILVNVVDAKLFSFTFKRMGGEIFAQAAMLIEDSSVYINMLTRYWYVALVGVFLICALAMCMLKFRQTGKFANIGRRDFAYFLVSMVALVIGIRGGLQGKPLKPVDVNIYAPTSGTVCLVKNTAFDVFHTRKKANMPRRGYFAADDIRLVKFSPRHASAKPCALSEHFKGKNVFIIILESFSAEHVGALDRQFKELPDGHFTPFLDSLIERSYVFDGFANGATSIDGLTSVMLGVPRLFNSSYITSAYGENAIVSLPLLLQRDGYKTMFFYGGKRNSCNFDSLRTKAQIEEYYCECDYDGSPLDISGWGVYDEEFFQFVAKKVNEAKKPFFSVLFTLSSHHPFLYPKRLHGKFPKGSGKEPMQELIAYTDYSLRRFFETAEKMDWYKNTIFVLVADHISCPQQGYYKNTLGGYSIPLMFFDPSGKLVGKSDEVAQQIDLMPSILDLIGISHDYFSFGSSLFDVDAPRFAVSYVDGIYQLIVKDFVLRFDGMKVVGFYERSDFLLKNNLANSESRRVCMEQLEEFMKVFLQRYSKSIRNNDMLVVE
ncbi:MAG: LTA synthase family protein [Puniceicoccales bacterium]|nr:LTA synthase family protein [Puniceicoccales bacterium]